MNSNTWQQNLLMLYPSTCLLEIRHVFCLPVNKFVLATKPNLFPKIKTCCNPVCWESESEVAQWYPTLCDPWTVAYQAPPSMGFSTQEYWSGVPFPSPGDLPDPGIEPRSPAFQADILTSEPPGSGVGSINLVMLVFIFIYLFKFIGFTLIYRLLKIDHPLNRFAWTARVHQVMLVFESRRLGIIIPIL